MISPVLEHRTILVNC